jgi:hypothetical protein
MSPFIYENIYKSLTSLFTTLFNIIKGMIPVEHLFNTSSCGAWIISIV